MKFRLWVQDSGIEDQIERAVYKEFAREPEHAADERIRATLAKMRCWFPSGGSLEWFEIDFDLDAMTATVVAMMKAGIATAAAIPDLSKAPNGLRRSAIRQAPARAHPVPLPP